VGHLRLALGKRFGELSLSSVARLRAGRSFPAVLLTLLMMQASACAGAQRPESATLDALSDQDLSFRVSMARGKASEELRCEGYSPQEQTAYLHTRFGGREARVRAALLARYGPDRGAIIPIGHRCPYVEGAVAEYDRALRQLERRLFRAH
jgi:hypothetical protein